jgi:hypothetical protein
MILALVTLASALGTNEGTRVAPIRATAPIAWQAAKAGFEGVWSSNSVG